MKFVAIKHRQNFTDVFSSLLLLLFLGRAIGTANQPRYLKAHLKLVLLAAKVGPLLLPKVVRLDDVRRVDNVPKMVLQHLQSGVSHMIMMNLLF